MEGEGLFNPNPVRDLSDGVGCIHGAALALDNDTLIYLDPLLIAFDDADMYPHGVTRAKLRMIHSHLFEIDSVDNIAHNVFVWVEVACNTFR